MLQVITLEVKCFRGIWFTFTMTTIIIETKIFLFYKMKKDADQTFH